MKQESRCMYMANKTCKHKPKLKWYEYFVPLCGLRLTFHCRKCDAIIKCKTKSFIIYWVLWIIWTFLFSILSNLFARTVLDNLFYLRDKEQYIINLGICILYGVYHSVSFLCFGMGMFNLIAVHFLRFEE